jgi:mannose-6-phosphate isomerase-like protein (cupin superfamily)
LKNFLLLLFFSSAMAAQERAVDPTWLHRSVSALPEASIDLSTESCRYKPIFGAGDPQSSALGNVRRFGQITVDSRGACNPTQYERTEEIFFVLSGRGILHEGEETHALLANDFTYVGPGIKHFISNSGDNSPLTVLVMTFDIPNSVAISDQSPRPKIVNLDTLKEETVQGHPNSVLYKLMVGPRNATRDSIDQAYVVTSLFWMDFAPGGTNFPHHHPSAEEIYLVIDGQGEMVAGGGMNGVEGHHPARSGDAYYFRPNCTVGFYNQKKPGAKAHILAVRSRVLMREEAD